MYEGLVDHLLLPTLSPEGAMFHSAARDYARGALRARNRELIAMPHRVEDREFPADIRATLMQMGAFGPSIDPEYGGGGVEPWEVLVVSREFAKFAPSLSTSMGASEHLCAKPIELFGNDDQKRAWLPDLASGGKIGSFCLTPPNGGSDPSACKASARKDGNYYVLNGKKMWITNGPCADVAVVFAQGEDGKLLALIVDLNSEGVHRGAPEDKIGIVWSRTSEMEFEDVKVPTENLLGMEGQGFMIAMMTLVLCRLWVALQAVSIAERGVELTLAYTLDRQIGGRPVLQYDDVLYDVAQWYAQIQASFGALRLTHDALMRAMGNPAAMMRVARDTSSAKLLASEMAVQVTLRCLQLHGGYGYVRAAEIQDLHAAAIVTTIYEGPSRVIGKNVVGRNILKQIKEGVSFD